MTYAVQSIEQFGLQLLQTQDLDPVYVALVRANLPQSKLHAWLLAYWCFYDAGVASWMAESHDATQDFWSWMIAGARNDSPAPTGGRWRRGKERRHFRGEAALRAVRSLATRYGEPDKLVQYLAASVRPNAKCKDVMKLVKQEYLFGDWIAFKVADMLETVLGLPVDFSDGAAMMFEEPRKAAILLAHQRFHGIDPDEAKVVQSSVDYLLAVFGSYRAPPRLQRYVDLQEIETILCKWKSHVNGHYPPGNDVHELRQSLAPWEKLSPTASRLLEAAP